MKVKEMMIGTPYYCQLDTNLGAATELMWVGNCGFLPVKGASGKVVGVITDRDICIAFGTRHCLPGDLTVREVMSNRLFACSPDCSVHAVLRIMEDGGVRRLPVIADDGSLVGVISMDDLLLKSEPAMTGIKAELSTDEVVQAYRAVGLRRMPQMVLVKAA